LLQLLRLTGMLLPYQDAAPTPATSTPERIGIWEPQTVDGRVSYLRTPATIADWPWWANIARIGPKQTRRRILFLGESVARGWLYEPLYTPAMVLQTTLQRLLADTSLEVVDLARTDMSTEIKDLAVKAAALEPDAVVIFAGNNWRAPDLTADNLLPEVAAALREEGVAGLKRLAETHIGRIAAAAVRQVRDFYRERGVPILWLIPEFNLGDWRDWRINAPHLRGNANTEWLACCEDAQLALQRKDFATVSALGERMLALDQGTNSYTHTLLAEVRRHVGDVQGARDHLEAARDARVWDWSQPLSPRCLAVTRRALLEEASSGTSSVLDLSDLFREYLGGDLPDRRLFLDYCHLTVEGIRLAMSGAAAHLARILTRRSTSWREVLPLSPAPEPAVEAEGALLAAVHSAHWWQPHPTIEHYCSRALQLSPGVADTMLHLLELQTTPTPALLSRPASELPQHTRQATQYLLGYNIQQLDVVLLGVMASALEKSGRPAASMLERQRLKYHDLHGRQIDLLSFYYLSSVAQPQELFWVTPPERRLRQFATVDYYRAFWIESSFTFVARGNRPVGLELTCRIPDADGDAQMFEIFMNDEPVVSLPGGPRWRRYSLQVEQRWLREGINSIRIRWPARPADQSEKLLQVIDSLRRERLRPLFQIFGEIHTFTVAATA